MSIKLFGVRFDASGELWSCDGHIVCHTDAQELHFLVDTPATTPFRIEEITNLVQVLGASNLLELTKHPDFKNVRFPLREEDFARESIERAYKAQDDLNRIFYRK